MNRAWFMEWVCNLCVTFGPFLSCGLAVYLSDYPFKMCPLFHDSTVFNITVTLPKPPMHYLCFCLFLLVWTLEHNMESHPYNMCRSHHPSLQTFRWYLISLRIKAKLLTMSYLVLTIPCMSFSPVSSLWSLVWFFQLTFILLPDVPGSSL